MLMGLERSPLHREIGATTSTDKLADEVEIEVLSSTNVTGK